MKNTGSRKQFDQARPQNNYSSNLLSTDQNLNKLKSVTHPICINPSLTEAALVSPTASDLGDDPWNWL